MDHWPFLEPIDWRYLSCIYKAYVREYPDKISPYMVQYLHLRILEFPLILHMDDMMFNNDLYIADLIHLRDRMIIWVDKCPN